MTGHKSFGLHYSGLKSKPCNFKVKGESNEVLSTVMFDNNSVSLIDEKSQKGVVSFQFNEQDITEKRLIQIHLGNGSYVDYKIKIITPHCWRIERIEKEQPNRTFIAGKLGQHLGVFEKLANASSNAQPPRVAKLVTKFYESKLGTLQFEKNYLVDDTDILVLTCMFTTSIHLGKLYQSKLAKSQQEDTNGYAIFNLVCASEGDGGLNFTAGSSGAGASSAAFYNGTGIQNPDEKVHISLTNSTSVKNRN